MASPPILDIPALLLPIPGDEPEGTRISFEIRSILEEGRKEFDPSGLPPDDPESQNPPKKADWHGIIDVAKQTLVESSKDLLVAARLTEALVVVHGYAGLRDGFQLLDKLIDECWDRMIPVIEDNEVDVRAGPFDWLDEADRGARFPNTIRSAPVYVRTGQDSKFSWLDWKSSQDGKGEMSREDIEKIIQASPRDVVQNAVEDIEATMQAVAHLCELLNSKMGPDAPGMTGIRQVLGDIRTLAKQILDQVGEAEPAETTGGDEQVDDDEDEGGTEVVTSTTTQKKRKPLVAGDAAATRKEAYRQLEEAANLLQKIEPHSPIPYLVQRACQLGKLPFPELIRALIREPNVLSELAREFGLKDPAETPSY